MAQTNSGVVCIQSIYRMLFETKPVNLLKFAHHYFHAN